MNRQEAVRRATELVEQMSVEELASQLRFDADFKLQVNFIFR